MKIVNTSAAVITVLYSLTLAYHAAAQGRQQNLTSEERQQLIEKRNAIESELESVAIIERKVMVPVRDGKRMATDIYRPRNASKKYPIIFSRTPYNFNYWDVRLGAPRDMSTELDAVKRGYVLIEMNERGHFFSEGNYEILGAPLSDADDEFNWMAAQPWSNGRVGLIGCSSTAEWQLGVASLGNKALTTIIPQSYGAGVGRVGSFYEQGNWYRGGAVQMNYIPWIYGEINQVRPTFPPDTSQADMVQASKLFDLAPQMPPVDWAKALTYLPEKDIIKAVGGPRGIFADPMPVPTGGSMIERTPNDPAWYKGGLWNDSERINVPGFWFMAWYDNVVGPNVAAYNYVRKTADPEIANEQYAIIAPTLHCGYKRATEHTVVGQRDVGDARLDYDSLTYGWFDHFLKGEDNHILEKMPKVRYYTMGLNKWQSSNTWPPEGVKPVTFYLTSQGNAPTLHGDGALVPVNASTDQPDTFTYDPLHPVLSYGGNFCCYANAIPSGGGAFDQRKMEESPNILVYTSDPLKDGLVVSGPIDVTLYVSSDVKDTDVTVKLIDVLADGTAYNLDETIQRLRYREGYDHPPAWLKSGRVYKVALTPMNTSNYFKPGDRIRIEISGSNFPRFDRNLNTGGNNYDETRTVIAHTQIHHSAQYPSSITLSVAPLPEPN
jgi:putative CocE/NonD family hydrolase